MQTGRCVSGTSTTQIDLRSFANLESPGYNVFMQKDSFWSWASLKQPVNQWIVFAFFGVCCFWLFLYYTTEKAKIVGDFYTAPSLSIDLKDQKN